MELQVVSGQLYILNGERQAVNTVPGLTAVPPPPRAARSRARDHLFIHLTLSGPPDETSTLANDLADAITATFYQSSGSVTAALRAAMLEANQLLLNLNLSDVGIDREGALICAALRGRDLYMVQTGESLAMIGHNFGVERLPAGKIDRVTPLGRSAGIDIRFFHNVLESGATLLLTDPRLAHLSPQSLEPALVDTDVEMGLKQLSQIVGPGTARLMLVEFTSDSVDDIVDGVVESIQPPEIDSTPTRRRGPIRARDVRPRTPPDPREVGTQLERTARRATAQTARGLARASTGVAEVMERLQPEPVYEEEQTGWAFPLLVAILIPVLVGVIVTGVYIQRGVRQSLADRKQTMAEAIGLAQQTDDSGEQRALYEQVVTLADAEGEISDADILRMRQQAQQELDRLDGIIRLTAVPLYRFSDTATLSSIALRRDGEGGVFTLDAGTNQVYLHRTDPTFTSLVEPVPEEIFFGGQALGGDVVGVMLDIMWQAGGLNNPEDRIAALDLDGNLLTYEVNMLRRNHAPLGLSSDWLRPAAITNYNERVYILDTEAQVIWRYLPDELGYLALADDRTLFFRDEPDLQLATDLAINDDDANLVLVYSDGQIRYYDTRSGIPLWDASTLAGVSGGLGQPFRALNAVKIVGSGATASIFAADPGTGRIVELGRGGTVLAQYKATDDQGRELFNVISDFAALKNPTRLLVTAGNIIYVATLE